MAWFERELQWGVPPTDLRHLCGRIGELYAALITNGQMAFATNQQGYDVVSAQGERISVKTTAMMGGNGQIAFNPSSLVPCAKWKTVFRHEISAARTAPRIAPRLDEMRSLHRTGRFAIAPDQLRRRFARRINGAVTQNHRWNFRPVKAGEFYDLKRPGPPPLPRERVKQLPAVAADDGLNLTMQATVHTAGNFHAVLALRTLEEIGLAHRHEIQPCAGNFKPPSPCPR